MLNCPVQNVGTYLQKNNVQEKRDRETEANSILPTMTNIINDIDYIQLCKGKENAHVKCSIFIINASLWKTLQATFLF